MMIAQAEKALAEDPSNGAALGIWAGGLAALGQRERATEWMDRAMLIDPDNTNMRYNFACVLAAQLGDGEAALCLLERTLPGAACIAISAAQTDPDFDSIRDNPRFKKLIDEATARWQAGLDVDDDGAAPAPH